MIPKIIHYIWFGRNPKPDIVLCCIASWKKFLPEYEIREWNEDTYDVNQNDYIREAYSAKKWAFVSDYARFDVLHKYGGIYFDTDVELLRELPDEFLRLPCFTGMESTNDINPGLIMGSEPEHPFLKTILDDYQNSRFPTDGTVPMTVNKRVTDMLLQQGYLKNGKEQTVCGITVFPAAVFCGFDLDVFEPMMTKDTVSIHHYSASWAYASFTKKRKFQQLLKSCIGVENYRTVLRFVRCIRKLRKPQELRK